MKTRYTEELLKMAIRAQLHPVVPKEVANVPLDHLAVGQLIKINGQKSLIGCVLAAHEQGLLIVLMDNFHVEKIQGYQYFKFSDELQGIQMKLGRFLNKFTLQFTDGTNYVFQVGKRNNKHLPNQDQNIKRIMTILDDQQRNDMKNSIYKQKVIRGKLESIFYWITMGIFMMMALNISLTYESGNDWLAFIVIVGSIFLHCIFILCVQLLVAIWRDKKFSKEFHQIRKNFHETGNAEAYLNALQTMRYSPKRKKSTNRFYLSMATALYRTNEKENALTYLGTIQTSEKELKREVEEKIDMIKDDLEDF